MKVPSDTIRGLSQELLAAEASARTPVDPHEAVVVCEKLRVSLVRLAGTDGFLALMRRALGLARVEFPVLETIVVNPDGKLEGLDRAVKSAGNDAAAAVIENLLSLLDAFIGDRMTLRILRENWPDIGKDEKN